METITAIGHGVYAAVTTLSGLAAGGSVAYLLTLLTAGALPTRRRPAADNPQPRIAVIVPAHDEEPVIAATLASLRSQDYPANRFEVVVLADNCTDRTAEIARAEGATVFERFNKTERGKGYALAEAVRLLMARPEPADAFAVVDADTWVAPNFLTIAARRLAIAAAADPQGRAAVQGRYGVLNGNEGWRAALMDGAFDLTNFVKPLGRERLGLSVGLKGSGMLFSRATLEAAPWQGRSITEDLDYGLDLLENQGVRVAFAPDAVVRAQMPTGANQAASQRARWEGGRYAVVRSRVPSLLRAAVRQRDLRLLDAATDLLIPPLAELAGLLAVWGLLVAAGAALGWLSGLLLIALSIAAGAAGLGLVLYILGGLRVSGAGTAAYAALAMAPFYAIWKFALYTRRKFTSDWVRTERAPLTAADAAAQGGGGTTR